MLVNVYNHCHFTFSASARVIQETVYVESIDTEM